MQIVPDTILLMIAGAFVGLYLQALSRKSPLLFVGGLQ
jgi:hypothetical protein